MKSTVATTAEGIMVARAISTDKTALGECFMMLPSTVCDLTASMMLKIEQHHNTSDAK